MEPKLHIATSCWSCFCNKHANKSNSGRRKLCKTVIKESLNKRRLMERKFLSFHLFIAQNSLNTIMYQILFGLENMKARTWTLILIGTVTMKSDHCCNRDTGASRTQGLRESERRQSLCWTWKEALECQLKETGSVGWTTALKWAKDSIYRTVISSG